MGDQQGLSNISVENLEDKQNKNRVESPNAEIAINTSCPLKCLPTRVHANIVILTFKKSSIHIVFKPIYFLSY